MSFYFSKAQEWMTSLKVAQSLASVENKMILMVWEDATFYSYPIFVTDLKTNRSVVVDLFANQEVQDLVWDYFIPVIVSEYPNE